MQLRADQCACISAAPAVPASSEQSRPVLWHPRLISGCLTAMSAGLNSSVLGSPSLPLQRLRSAHRHPGCARRAQRCQPRSGRRRLGWSAAACSEAFQLSDALSDAVPAVPEKAVLPGAAHSQTEAGHAPSRRVTVPACLWPRHRQPSANSRAELQRDCLPSGAPRPLQARAPAVQDGVQPAHTAETTCGRSIFSVYRCG